MVTDPQTYTHTQTQPQIHRQDRLQYTAPLCLARSVKITDQDLHENFARLHLSTRKPPLNLGSHQNLDPDSVIFNGIFTTVGPSRCVCVCVFFRRMETCLHSSRAAVAARRRRSEVTVRSRTTCDTRRSPTRPGWSHRRQ